MKKAISLLLVLAVTLGLSVVAFAATEIPDNYGAYGTNHNTYGRTSNYGINNYAATASEDSGVVYLGESGMLYAANVSGGTDLNTYTLGQLLLVNDKKVVGSESLLRPDETYKFDIYYATGGVTVAGGTPIANVPEAARLTKTQVGTGTVRIRTVKGSSYVQSAKIKTSGSGAAQNYYVELVTRANYGTKINDVEYVLSVLNPTATLTETTHMFQVGFNAISDTETDVGEFGTITISNDAPVILKEQFTDIAKSANYKNVTFESDDGNWAFTGKVAGMKDTNFAFNYDPDTNLLNRYPEHDFKFLNFPAGVNFPTTGEMRIDVSDISDVNRTLYAYLYREGRLTEINGTYDAVADQIVFRTNYLGRFVISDRPITEATIPEEPEEVVPEPEVPNTTNNPHTGAAAPDAMVAIGLLTLASAAVITRKRGK
jgi:LPXTG-motif cell wall-anchored protein